MPSNPRTLAAAAAIAAALTAGCVSSTTITYLPSPEQPRLTLEEGRGMLARFVGVECGRLVDEGKGTGSADLLARTGPDGAVASAELTSGSGDERANGVMGAVVAQLRLDSDDAGREIPLRAGYQCTDGGATALLERR